MSYTSDIGESAGVCYAVEVGIAPKTLTRSSCTTVKLWILYIVSVSTLLMSCGEEKKLLSDGNYFGPCDEPFESNSFATEISSFNISGDTVFVIDKFQRAHIGTYSIKENQLKLIFKTREFESTFYELKDNDSLFVIHNCIYRHSIHYKEEYAKSHDLIDIRGERLLQDLLYPSLLLDFYYNEDDSLSLRSYRGLLSYQNIHIPFPHNSSSNRQQPVNIFLGDGLDTPELIEFIDGYKLQSSVRYFNTITSETDQWDYEYFRTPTFIWPKDYDQWNNDSKSPSVPPPPAPQEPLVSFAQFKSNSTIIEATDFKKTKKSIEQSSNKRILITDIDVLPVEDFLRLGDHIYRLNTLKGYDIRY